MTTADMQSPAPPFAPIEPAPTAVPTPAGTVLAAWPPIAATPDTVAPPESGGTRSNEAAPLAVAVPVKNESPPACASEPSPSSEFLSAEEDDAKGLIDDDDTQGAWKKHVWTPKEDAQLLELMAACGNKVRWSVVGEQMNGRSGKQCRERWHNHLSPDVRKT